MVSRHRLLEAQFDYAAFYLHTLQQWETQFQRTETPSVRAAFEEDWQQIQQAQAWCAEQSAASQAAAELCSAFGRIDNSLLESYQTPAAQIDWYRAAVTAARVLNDPDAEVQHVRQLALSYGRMGDYAAGVQQLHEALTRHAALTDANPLIRAQLHNSAGDLLNALGEPQAAETHYLESLVCTVPDQEAHAHSLWGLSGVYNTLSRMDEALAYAEQSRAYYERTGNTLRLAEIAGRIGEIRYTQGNYRAARDYQQVSIALAEQIGYLRGLTIAYRNLAYIANDQGELDESEQQFARSITYVQRLGDLREHAILLGGLGQLQWRRGDHTAAAATFRQSFAYCEQTGDQIGMAYMLINLGKVQQQAGDYPQALRELEQAQTILERLGEPWGQAKVLMSLGELAQKQGDHTRAAEYFQQMLVSVETIGDLRGQTLAWIGLGKAAHGRGHAAEALAAYQRALMLAQSVPVMPMLLEALLGFAEVWYLQGDIPAAIALLGFLLNHPQSESETRSACAALIAQVRQAHPGQPVDDLLAHGAQHDLAHFITAR